MKAVLIIFSFMHAVGLSAQDSLKFEFSDSVFVVGQEKEVEIRFELCAPFGTSDWNLAVFDSLMNLMQINITLKVSITHHTDGRGSTDANQKLSELRAKAITTELVKRGISKDRIEAIGKGETEPIHSEEEVNKHRKTNREKFEQLHQINRRTIIRITQI